MYIMMFPSPIRRKMMNNRTVDKTDNGAKQPRSPVAPDVRLAGF